MISMALGESDHCTSEYPTPPADVNLKAISTLSDEFGLTVGFSDHSEGILIPVIAVGLGIKLIEKHFTLDKNLPGPDHKASSTPDEFEELVKSVRRAEKMLGSPVKYRQEEEEQMAKVSRKSIFVNKDISKNNVIQLSDLTMKRPSTGLEAKFIKYFVGKKINDHIKKGTPLSWDMLSKKKS